ncbi:hypothetical protein Prudu_306S000200, partial [Prunus dulcis]
PVTSSPSSRPSRHHTATRSPAPVPSEPQLAADFSRPTPAVRTPEPGRNWPLLPSVVFELSVRISPSFLHQIFRAPGVRLIHRRDLREVQLARTSSRRRTRETTRAVFLASDPPPKCRNSLCRTRTGVGSVFKAKIGSGPVNLVSEHSLKMGPKRGGFRRGTRQSSRVRGQDPPPEPENLPTPEPVQE